MMNRLFEVVFSFFQIENCITGKRQFKYFISITGLIIFSAEESNDCTVLCKMGNFKTCSILVHQDNYNPNKATKTSQLTTYYDFKSGNSLLPSIKPVGFYLNLKLYI
jgi:hypothetical protein